VVGIRCLGVHAAIAPRIVLLARISHRPSSGG
jgi:hypothetical protein